MKIGDKVCLKGSLDLDTPLRMTVVDVSEYYSGMITCVWFNRNGDLQRAEFPLESISEVS